MKLIHKVFTIIVAVNSNSVSNEKAAADQIQVALLDHKELEAIISDHITRSVTDQNRELPIVEIKTQLFSGADHIACL